MNVKHKNDHWGIHSSGVWGRRVEEKSSHYTERAPRGSVSSSIRKLLVHLSPSCCLGSPSSALIMQKPWASGHPALLPPSSTRD